MDRKQLLSAINIPIGSAITEILDEISRDEYRDEWITIRDALKLQSDSECRSVIEFYESKCERCHADTYPARMALTLIARYVGDKCGSYSDEAISKLGSKSGLLSLDNLQCLYRLK
jgi:hypothetical protein